MSIMRQSHYQIDNVAWGMELEGYVQNSLRHCTMDVARADYAHRLGQLLDAPVLAENSTSYLWHPHRWLVTFDTTIEPPRNGVDIEIKSPILAPADIELLPRRLRQIKRSKLQTNNRCALHLHASPLSGQRWSVGQAVGHYKNFRDNLPGIVEYVDYKLFDTARAPRNPWVEDWQLNNVTTHEELADLICPLPPHSKSETLLSKLQERRRFQLNVMPMLPVSATDPGKGSHEDRPLAAEDYETSAPLIRMFLSMAACSIRGEKFVLNEYAETVANDREFALPTPSRPQPQPVGASLARS